MGLADFRMEMMQDYSKFLSEYYFYHSFIQQVEFFLSFILLFLPKLLMQFIKLLIKKFSSIAGGTLYGKPEPHGCAPN